ncbi:hypothetical protein BDU57DRAFT_551546 [Ampelomyces quisqualis]|uniref:Uncharacterized protein n=1 Tax=Ampelomyces quisqualis TaxID=50730 RepID=A0A6A5QAV2_AMPQU|nr:hypothetical protein BDU57DRAFT_551546 [Ampelomyces quisqualis]
MNSLSLRTSSDKLDRWHFSGRRKRLRSPDLAADDYQIESLSPTPPPQLYGSRKDPVTSPARDAQPDAARAQLDPRPVLHQPSRNYQQGPFMGGMNSNPPSPSQEFVVIKDDDDLVPPGQPDKDQARDESSEDDAPLMMRRRLRESANEQNAGTAPRQPGSLRDTTHLRQRDSVEHARDRPAIRQGMKTSPKQASTHKKPGPRAWAAKPIMKNDLKAKMEVVREIEGFWGRGFIKSYIPKCHRPLVKRNGGSKRSIYREHETSPKNWLPSVLKAILMIAKLTDDKQWLKKAMSDVVRYRIKHTGNRKPQLVTTDFDVIEDMLVKDWTVPYSFEIRYKHLLVNRKDQEEDDEVIDNILLASPDREDDGSDEEEDNEDRNLDDQEEEEDTGRGRSSISNNFLQSNGCTKTSRFESLAPPRKRQKHSNTRQETPSGQHQIKQEHAQQQYRGNFGYGGQVPGYGPPMNPWGLPMSGYGGPDAFNNGFGGYVGNGGGGYNSYGAYGGYGGYGHPPHGQNVREGSQPPPHRGMPPSPSPRQVMIPAPSIPDLEHGPHGCHPKRGGTSPMANARSREAYGPPHGFAMQSYPGPYDGGRTRIKRESPGEERPNFNNDNEAIVNDAGYQDDDLDDEDAADAEVEVMELELKLAKLKAARLRERRKNN